jgi:hypothetical protein
MSSEEKREREREIPEPAGDHHSLRQYRQNPPSSIGFQLAQSLAVISPSLSFSVYPSIYNMTNHDMCLCSIA